MKPPSEFDFCQPVGSNGFYRYRIAAGLHPMKGNQQVNTLLYIMGEEADEIMKSFTFKKVYTKYFTYNFTWARSKWPPMQRFRPIGGRSVCELCVFIVTCSSNTLFLQVRESQPTEVSYVTGDHKIAQVYPCKTWCSRCCPFRKWSTIRLWRV